MTFLNRSVQYATRQPAIQGGIELFSSNHDIGVAMGRPRKFSREGVLQKALPVFWKYGFARTTLPDLEQATGVNKSGLYAEFDSKEALFLACLRHYLDTRSAGALLVAEPLGWRNIERFLEEAPSFEVDQQGCFCVNSMRELDGLPAEARKVIANGLAKTNQLLRAERSGREAHDGCKRPVRADLRLLLGNLHRSESEPRPEACAAEDPGVHANGPSRVIASRQTCARPPSTCRADDAAGPHRPPQARRGSRLRRLGRVEHHHRCRPGKRWRF